MVVTRAKVRPGLTFNMRTENFLFRSRIGQPKLKEWEKYTCIHFTIPLPNSRLPDHLQ